MQFAPLCVDIPVHVISNEQVQWVLAHHSKMKLVCYQIRRDVMLKAVHGESVVALNIQEETVKLDQ